MATANTSMDSMPPLPSKHTSQRHSNLTPSPEPYDQPRPPSQGGSQQGSQPPSPLVGHAPISPYPQPYNMPQPSSRSSSQQGSRPPSISGSRTSLPTDPHQYASIQPYPQPYGSNPASPTSPQPFIQPAAQPYPGMQADTQSYPMQGHSQPSYGAQQQPYSSPSPLPPPSSKKTGGGQKERIPTWLVLSIVTIFINPIFGFIALAFSLMSMGARTKTKRKKYGQIAKHCCIVGIGLTVCLAAVAAVVIGTNNRGWRRDLPDIPDAPDEFP